ncbi:LamG-like jellyroll fold domain-containing protein [Streptomyces sp. NPDC001292]|uniref:protein kinase domain-containing protein n=1 Tax=Streptomyces sp. NPDC001292 TaxID=3364558 RepID=UPI00369B0430
MAALSPEDPRFIGGYQLLGRLGAGGMGRVFLGRSPGGRQVAVKVVHAALVDRPDFRSRFRREVEAARAVSGAFTAPLIDADPDAAEPWLVTSYIAGPSLEQAVTDQGPMTAPRVFALAAGLAEALVSIHSAHLVHRDLKPSNVLLAADGPRVIDFGIARVVEGSSPTATGHVLGSPGFMSPEQASGEKIGPASDVFSLGTVLAYAAAGDNPFGNGHPASVFYRVVHDTPDLSSVTDPALRALITDCLAKDPTRRPTPRQILARCGVAGAPAPVESDHLPTAAGRSEATLHDTAPSGRSPGPEAAVGIGGECSAGSAMSPGGGGGRDAGGVPGGAVESGVRSETAYRGYPSANGAVAAPTDPRIPMPSAPEAGPTTAPRHDVSATPIRETAITHPRRVGTSGRRGAVRRKLLISVAAAAAAAAVGVPMARTFGPDAETDTVRGSAPVRPSGPKPVGAWRLDERSGTYAADTAGFHDGTASDVRWGAGDSGAALFNGVSSQITTRGPVLGTAPGHSFTVSAWVYLTSASGFATAVSQGASGSSAFFLQYSGSDHRWAFSRPGVRALAAKPPVMNTWTHLVGVCDGDAHRLRLYVNGTQRGTANDNGPVTTPGSLMIGRATFNGRPADFFPGGIKNVQVFDQALSADQVAALD